jgi:hypothetical protein
MKSNAWNPPNNRLWSACKLLPSDFEPYVKRSRSGLFGAGPDCSGGCKWFHTLNGEAGMDWGVCLSPASPRAGLLTFEHQGCRHFQESRKTGSVLGPHG